MQTDIRRYGARPVVLQAATAPGLQPQRGPTADTGRPTEEGKRRRFLSSPASQPESPAIQLVFAQWNAEGLRKKKPELQEFLKREEVDIICIQETHLTDAHRFTLRGYEPFRHDRADRHKGGICTFVRNTIPAIEIKRSQERELEFLAVKIVFHRREVTVINCYCPQDKELQLHTLPLTNQNLLIAGDFNSHSPSWGYPDLNNRGEQMEDWMIENKLILVNRPDDRPTCFSRAWKTTSTPDLAITTEDIQKICDRTVCSQLGGSDHLPVLLKLSLTEQPAPQRKDASWNYKKADWPKFHQLTDKLCMENNIDSNKDINSNVKQLTNCILEAAKQSIPRGRRRDYKPYWSDKLQTLHDQLTVARNRLEQHPSPENNILYHQARTVFDEQKTQEARKSWQEKTGALNMEKDTQKLWNLTKTLNDDQCHAPRAALLKEKDHLYTGRKAAALLADKFQQDSFLDVPREKTTNIRMKTKDELRKQTPTPSMTSKLTIQELNCAIRQLKMKKSPGKDGITNEMIRHLGEHAKQKLLDIYNQSWTTGVFPTSWKEAIIVPILKKGKDKYIKDSYRPISLLSCLGKTMERIINRRLQYHLEKNGLLIPTQSGYRKNRSTEDQVTLLTQDIEDGFQQKLKTLAIFVDLSRAFDKVWKEGLLFKLLQKKVCGRMFSWIQSYLFNRTARVKLEGHISTLVKIREGVPQGGVISPTLFTIFIDDIADQLSTHIPRALHADDLAIWTKAEQITTAAVRMQEGLNHISNWAREWLVTINRTKTEATCFSLSPKREVFTLSVNNQEIPQQDNPTYLGVKLDRKLTWSPQINSMHSKGIRKMALMKKLAGTKWGANTKVLTQVYTATVRPHMEYASNAWSTAAKTNLDNLTKTQNAGLRLITGGMKTTPIPAMEKTTGIMSLEERRNEKLLLQNEKMKRLPSHPLHSKLKAPTKNRLKRQSPKHLIKALERKLDHPVTDTTQQTEKLKDYEDWQTDTPPIIYNIQGVSTKDHHSTEELKSLTLEALNTCYPPTTWARAYTDGSAEEAVKNGGGGLFIKFPDGRSISKSVATGTHSTNFRAEACALLHAAETLNKEDSLPTSTVFLTDCKSVLQSLQTPGGDQTVRAIREELDLLKQRTGVVLQWIPSHVGVRGNEEADRLSKIGSRQEQSAHPMSYREVRCILKNSFRKLWRQRLGTGEEEDSIHQLDRAAQVIIFRLRTGHCQLLSHMFRLKLSDTDQCPCGTGPQTPTHILQSCPSFKALRLQTWPSPVEVQEKLWGPATSLRQTADLTT